MIKLELTFGLLVMALWVFSVIDVIISDEGAIRSLPAGPPEPQAHERAMPHHPEHDRPGRAAASSPEEDGADSAGSGLLIGYGARWAGGCTSGHGISGCSAGSPESLAATTAFFSVAILTTLVVHLLSGGAV